MLGRLVSVECGIGIAMMEGVLSNPPLCEKGRVFGRLAFLPCYGVFDLRGVTKSFEVEKGHDERFRKVFLVLLYVHLYLDSFYNCQLGLFFWIEVRFCLV